MEAARADVFGLLVDADGVARDRVYGVFGEFEFDALGFEQGLVLLDERVLRLGQDALEVFERERVQLDAYGEASL